MHRQQNKTRRKRKKSFALKLINKTESNQLFLKRETSEIFNECPSICQLMKRSFSSRQLARLFGVCHRKTVLGVAHGTRFGL